MRELADVEADIEANDNENAFEPDLQDAPDTVPTLVTDRTSDEAMDRLMETASSKLDEEDGNSRRAAYSHLRAAVAATEAEKDASKDREADDTNGDAFRADLALQRCAHAARKPPQRPTSGARRAVARPH